MDEVVAEGAATVLAPADSTPDVSSTGNATDGKATAAAAAAPALAVSVTWGKQRADLKRQADSTVSELKEELERLWGVQAARQKLMFKGLMKNDKATLGQVGIKDGAKVMLIGSRDADVAAASRPKEPEGPAAWDAPPPPEEPLSKQAQHAKVLGKGRPEDGLAGVKGRQVPLPDGHNVIPGLLNSQGSKVRLTFRPDLSQLWIGSATSTQKIPYSSVRSIESWPIEGQEEYSIVALALGAGKYWLYFFPSQLVSTLKVRVLGIGALIM